MDVELQVGEDLSGRVQQNDYQSHFWQNLLLKILNNLVIVIFLYKLLF